MWTPSVPLIGTNGQHLDPERVGGAIRAQTPQGRVVRSTRGSPGGVRSVLGGRRRARRGRWRTGARRRVGRGRPRGGRSTPAARGGRSWDVAGLVEQIVGVDAT